MRITTVCDVWIQTTWRIGTSGGGKKTRTLPGPSGWLFRGRTLWPTSSALIDLQATYAHSIKNVCVRIGFVPVAAMLGLQQSGERERGEREGREGFTKSNLWQVTFTGDLFMPIISSSSSSSSSSSLWEVAKLEERCQSSQTPPPPPTGGLCLWRFKRRWRGAGIIDFALFPHIPVCSYPYPLGSETTGGVFSPSFFFLFSPQLCKPLGI